MNNKGLEYVKSLFAAVGKHLDIFVKNECMKFERISIDPGIMLGKPCIKGTRITVELILEKLAGGATVEWILDGYPRLTSADIEEAIIYSGARLSRVK